MNPIKILIPAALGIVVLFAVVWALTRNSGTAANTNTTQQPSLIADPNSQPVKPVQPPTGKGEEGIPAGGVITPTNVNTNVNTNAAVGPSPIDEITPVANTNENANTNRKAPTLPEPTRTVTPDTEPPPPPSETKSPASKPSPTPSASPEN